VDRYEWNKDQNAGKRVTFNEGTENNVWGVIIGEKSVTFSHTTLAVSSLETLERTLVDKA